MKKDRSMDPKRLQRPGSTPSNLPAQAAMPSMPARVELLPVAPRLAAPAPESESLLVEYCRLIFRRRWTIALFALSGALLAFLATLPARQVFQSRTSLDIQNVNVDFMNMRNVSQTGQVSGTGSAEIYIQTEIKLLQSRALLMRTVQRMTPEASSLTLRRSNNALAALKRRLHMPGSSMPSPKDILEFTEKSVTVKPLGLTRMVEITCEAWDPKFAADFCNAFTAEFQLQDREVRYSEAQKTSEWLNRQLADVREELKDSEHKLEAAAEGNGLLFSQNSTSVGEQKLRDLQSELMKGQAERVQKEAQFEITKSSPPDSLPMVLDNSELRDLGAKLSDLKRQLAEIMPPLTDAHPKVQHLKAQIAELQAGFVIARNNVVERSRNEYLAAKGRESLLSSAYNAQEHVVSQELGKESQVNMLRREVDSGQTLYQTLLQRVKEAGFASALQASTVRVVDSAEIPLIPIGPRRGRSAAVGLILGTLLGIGFAFFKERTETVLRLPGETARYLSVRELGVIPSASIGRTTRRLAAPSGTGSYEPAYAGSSSVDVAGWNAQTSLVAEAYRNATYSILLECRNQGGKSYVVSSPSAGEGKTTVTCNLGIALAQANRRVLLVDGDLRKPKLHMAMGVANDFGLRNMLRGEADLGTYSPKNFCKASQVPNLFVLPSGTGTEEASRLLYSSSLPSILERLTAEFDVVLIDTPPVLHLADARILAGMTNGTILVFRARSTDREAALHACSMFHHDQVRIVGSILNDFDPMREGQGRYYNSYYEYQDLGAGAEAESF